MKNLSQITDFLEFLGDAILIADDQSQIIFVNTACAHLFGYEKEKMIRLRLDDLIEKPEGLNHSKMVKNYVNSDASSREMMGRVIMPCIDAKGGKFNSRISIAIVKINDKPYGLATINDYTLIQNEISALETKSNVDMLTNLFNRHYLHQVFKENSRILSSWTSIGVLYLDLNEFKPINDNLGHRAGDEILKSVANKLKGSVRFDDIVFRIGGDEFLILVNFNDVSDKLEALRNMCNIIGDKVSEPFFIKKEVINMSISIGAGIYPDDNNDLAELIHYTDKAMYVSKKKSVVVSFVSDLNA